MDNNVIIEYNKIAADILQTVNPGNNKCVMYKQSTSPLGFSINDVMQFWIILKPLCCILSGNLGAVLYIEGLVYSNGHCFYFITNSTYWSS